MSETILCKRCRKEWDVSEEDPDATMGDALHHTYTIHGLSDPREQGLALKLVN